MPDGRPRTTSFEPEEMIELGKEMVEWVKKNKETILHLSEWYTIEKMFTYNQWKQFIAKKEFHPYYEQALKIIGRKYLEKDNNVRDRISDRWQRIYFGDLREEEDLTKLEEIERKKILIEFEHTLKKQVLETVSDDVKSQFETLMRQIENMRNDDNKLN